MRNPYYTRVHMVIEILSYVFLAASFLVALIGVLTMPEEIPNHFNYRGEIDSYGSKGVLFLMPGIILFAQLLVSASIHLIKPEKWNLAFDVKERRKHLVYRDAVMMNVLSGLSIGLYVFIFELLYLMGAGRWFLWEAGILVAVIIAIVIVGYVRMIRHNR